MRTALFIWIIGLMLAPMSLSAQANERSYKTFHEQSYEVGDKILAPVVMHELSAGGRIRPESNDSIKVIAEFLDRTRT